MTHAAKEPEKKTTQDPEFAIQRLYVKDLSLETPNSPAIFLEKWEPTLNMELGTDASFVLEENIREVVLTVTVTVKVKEKVAFLVEVKQAGIFSLKGFTEEQLHQMLGSFCPNILYPYAREVVTDAVIRAGFPQLYLAPVNFDMLYAQQKKQAEEKKAAEHKAKK
ncbi:MAG: preprotein translocase subunit SecB [uncultured bacterium]|nr:MAG: preprotein translocase subunit SecB [uncultured bacterium]